ncbi:MAG: SCO family protein [Planctomycetota bacterium]|jgi:protein SCO1/2
MKPIFITGALALGLLILGVSSFVVATRGRNAQGVPAMTRSADPLEADLHMETLSIPPFELTGQRGETVTDEYLDGHLTIVAFMFTNCPFICPPMGFHLTQALTQLEGTDVRVLTFSVDPEHDTPEAIAAHLATLGADQDRWTWVTGDIAQVNTILTEGLSLPEATTDTSREITLDTGAIMSNVSHPSFFFLLDPERNVLALYDGTNREQVDQMILRARMADFAWKSR